MATLYGRVNSRGTTLSGSSGGFTTSKLGTGQYLIDFSSKFKRPPSVVATPIGSKPKGTQSDNVINVDIKRGYCRIWMFDTPKGGSQDGGFSFIVMGK